MQDVNGGAAASWNESNPKQQIKPFVSQQHKENKPLGYCLEIRNLRPQITVLALSFLCRFCFLSFVGFLPFLHLLRSLVFSVLCYKLLPFLLLSLGLLPARLAPHSLLSNAYCVACSRPSHSCSPFM